MADYTWIRGACPADIPVRQVYAVAFSADGSALLREDGGHTALIGGRPESCDGDIFDTARREFVEEVNAEIGDMRYLGYLLVEENGEKYAQVRLTARLLAMGQALPDPDTGRTYGRRLVPASELKEHLGYSDAAGNSMLDDAIALAAREYGISLNASEGDMA